MNSPSVEYTPHSVVSYLAAFEIVDSEFFGVASEKRASTAWDGLFEACYNLHQLAVVIFLGRLF